MKGFFRWFKSGAKMKRWILLIVIGVLLTCYGIMQVITPPETLGFKELAMAVISFVIGLTALVIGIVLIQRRTLEILVEESDTREQLKEGKVKSLIFNKKVYDEGPNIVVIGGGTGINSVLRGLKNYTNNITAIVTVSDYGNGISASSKELELLPLEDIKTSLISLSSNEAVMEAIMNYKFETGKLKSLSFGDIYFSAMKELCGDFTTSIEQAKNVLNISGKVLPVTLEAIDICAELDDGTVIQSKDKIPSVVESKISKINRIFINPSNCMPAPGVLEAIQNADAIIIGPGSLYTNVIPNLLVKGVAKAIKENKGFKIYVSNIMTEPGQTDNYSLSDHIKAIIEHAGKGIVDYCIYDTGEIVPEFIRKYNKDGRDLVDQDVSKAKELGVRLIQRNLSYIDGEYIRHNPEAIALSVIELVCEEMKFRDMQNDAQYIMLNSRAKETKKKLKETIGKKLKPKIKLTSDEKKGSKFAEKYKDRIVSIRESTTNATKRKNQKEMEKSKKTTKKPAAKTTNKTSRNVTVAEKNTKTNKPKTSKTTTQTKKTTTKTTKTNTGKHAAKK